MKKENFYKGISKEEIVESIIYKMGPYNDFQKVLRHYDELIFSFRRVLEEEYKINPSLYYKCNLLDKYDKLFGIELKRKGEI